MMNFSDFLCVFEKYAFITITKNDTKNDTKFDEFVKYFLYWILIETFKNDTKMMIFSDFDQFLPFKNTLKMTKMVIFDQYLPFISNTKNH